MRARREARGAHPSPFLPHPAREVRVLKRHGEGEGESDVGADLTRQDFLEKCDLLKATTSRLASGVDNDTQPMESLSETKWDVVIAGTGLAQSLLALSVL